MSTEMQTSDTTNEQGTTPGAQLSATLAPAGAEEAARSEIEKAAAAARVKGDSKSLMAYLRLKRRAAD